MVHCKDGSQQDDSGYGAGGRTPQHGEVPWIMNGKKNSPSKVLICCILVGILDLENSDEESCLPPFYNFRQQNLPQRQIKWFRIQGVERRDESRT